MGYSRSRSRSRSPRRGEERRGGGGGGGYDGGGGGGKGMGGKGMNRNEDAKLYVGNLSFDAQADNVRPVFEKYGVVTDVFLPMDRDTGKSRGFGFVTYDRVCEAEDAAAGLDGVDFEGRRLKVRRRCAARREPARARTQAQPRAAIPASASAPAPRR